VNAPAIRLADVSKRFGTLTAVDHLDLSVPAGEVVALLGPNGAGKSTTVDMILGLARPTAGTVELFGQSPAAAIGDGRVGAMLQNGSLLPALTIRQNVALIAAAHRHPLPVDEALARADVSDIAGRKVAKLSGGQLQRARFAVAVVSDPDVIILDEPTAAMDVESRRIFWRSMREFTTAGRTVVFATHYLDEADEFADRIVILSAGRIAADGTPAEIKARAAGRILTFRLPAESGGNRDDFVAAPGVTGVERRQDRFRLFTDASDDTLRWVLGRFPSAHDVQVTAHTMDDAFVALTTKEVA
jgi:ABC-2 type transport system ATP-binding protein